MRYAALLTALLTALLLQGRDPNRLPGEAPGNHTSAILTGYAAPDSVMARLAHSDMHAVEGLWEFPASRGLVAIERRDDSRRYLVVAVAVENRAIRPGTVLGHLEATGQRGKYRAWLFSELDDDTSLPRRPREYTATIEGDDTHLSFASVRRGLRVNIFRLLPFTFRSALRYEDRAPTDLGGLVRVYPLTGTPADPVYL